MDLANCLKPESKGGISRKNLDQLAKTLDIDPKRYSKKDELCKALIEAKSVTKKSPTKAKQTQVPTKKGPVNIRKDTRKVAEYLISSLPLTVTGLRRDETAKGFKNKTMNAIITYKGDNIISPERKELDIIKDEKDLWPKFLQKLGTISFFSSMTNPQREEWLNNNATSKTIYLSEVPNSRIQIVEFGDSDFLNVLSEDEISSLMEDSKDGLSTSQIQDLFPGVPGSRAARKTLIFNAGYWHILRQPESTTQFDGLVLDLKGDIHTGLRKASSQEKIYTFNHYLDDEDFTFGIVVPNDGVNLHNTKEIDSIFQSIYGQSYFEDLAFFNTNTSIFTPAGLKSLMQKIIRFRPLNISFPIDGKDDIIIKSDKALILTMRNLLTHPGSFVPDIQRYVTGPESLFKRLSIIIYEDASFDFNTQSSSLLSFIVGAYLFQRIKEFRPPKELITSLIDMAVNALSVDNYIDYGSKKLPSSVSYSLNDEYQNDNRYKLKLNSALMDQLRSFKGDLYLLRWCATYPKLIKAKPNVKIFTQRPKIMPLCHCIDQHWLPEIAYYYPLDTLRPLLKGASKAKPYEILFSKLFTEVTGFNPRKEAYSKKFESLDFIFDTRIAQLRLYWAKHKQPLLDLYSKSGEMEYNYPLDESWLAGMVGAIPISGVPSTLVTLHPFDINQLVVIKKPSRGETQQSATLSEKRQAQSKAEALKILGNGYKLKASPAPIKQLQNSEVILLDNQYYIINKLFPKISIGQQKYRAKRWEDLRLVSDLIDLYDDKPLSVNELMFNDIDFNGVSFNIEQELQLMKERYTNKEFMKGMSYLNSYNLIIEVNNLGRDGGGSKQGVTPEDAGALNILLELSSLLPGCLTRDKAHTHRFEVINGPLLWHIRDDYLIPLMDFDQRSKIWPSLGEKKGRTLRQHQQDSLDIMKARHKNGKKNHFLWLSVGAGKTLLVLKYLEYLNNRKELPPYVIYTLPESSIKSIVEECLSMGFEVNILSGNKTQDPNVSYRQYMSNKCKPIKYKINLIEHDQLRKCDASLKEYITDSILIVDEVHKTLDPKTQRTTTALELSKLSQEVVALTGTPIIDNNTYKLAWWLGQVVDFAVTEQNFWVAANGMIAKIYKPDVVVNYLDEPLDMNIETKKEYIKHVPPAMGGINKFPSNRDFMTAMDICYEYCTREMVKIIKRYVKEDKGIFVVTKDKVHQNEIHKLLVKTIPSKEIFLISKGQSLYLTDDQVSNHLVPDYKVVITTIRHSAGYTLTRLKAMITSVYPSNQATRTQLEGRVVRMGQKAKAVDIITVNTGILSHILEKHNDAKNLESILRKLADEI